jgi:hypothetical protein
MLWLLLKFTDPGLEGRASFSDKRVKGMHKFPNSVKPLTQPGTGDMDGSSLFFVVCQQESGIVWGRTGGNPSGITLALYLPSEMRHRTGLAR